MYFSQIRRNASKNRKNNGIFFSSLVVATVAFYTLLSLEKQDVMVFLETMESDAISKLMLLVPLVYMVSLFFVFFLVYFAYRYQLDKRKREFGLYLMLGMKRGKLWAMLMGETAISSIVSLAIGLPIALFLTEAISLTTAKLVGIGIVGHSISFSLQAILLTVVGFFAIQLAAMIILSTSLARKEPLELLNSDSPVRQSSMTEKKALICLVLGILFLGASYVLGIAFLKNFSLPLTGLVLLLVGIGTFLAYKGLGTFIGRSIRKRSSNRSGLFIFTGRQIQENVLFQYKTMAVSSLLFLLSLTCISFGIGTAVGTGTREVRSVDLSISGTEQEVRQVLDSEERKEMLAGYYPMYLSMPKYEVPREDDLTAETGPEVPGFSWEGLESVIRSQPSDQGDILLQNLSQGYVPYLIKESSYNELLASTGLDPLQLESNQVAFFSSMESSLEYENYLTSLLSQEAFVEIGYETYELAPTFYTSNIVADQKISLLYALIVPDALYQQQASDPTEPFCWNAVLKPEIVSEMGLIQALLQLEESLTGTGLEYESYLTGIGRNLFYLVGASYLTLYLGILFVIIANTVISIKYLTQQRENRRRYQTLLTLGARTKDLCRSSRTQIKLFFGLVLGLAVFSSVFAIWSLFSSFLRLPANVSLTPLLICAGVALIVFIGIECLYVHLVGRVSDREIHSLQITERRIPL